MGHLEHHLTEIQQTLQQSLDFLAQSCAGVALARRGGADCVARVAHVTKRLEVLQAERPSLPSALILGEFKAGKSTLINALTGKTVAAVDETEMTHAVCRIVPTSGPETVYLTSEDNSQPPLHLTLPEFLRRCQARALNAYTQATAYVDTSGHSPNGRSLDIVLIDSPGLGAAHQHEQDAVSAIATADIVLYAVDAESLGNARDVALIQRIRDVGLPMVCVLTKIDVFAQDEISIALEYLADQMGVPPDSIFPISALQYLQSGQKGGVDELRRFLTRSVAPQRESLRAKSLYAQMCDTATELSEVYVELNRQLAETLQNVEAYHKALETTALAVTKDLAHYMAERLRSMFRREAETMLIHRLSQETATEEEIAEVLKLGLSPEKQQQFMEEMKTHLGGRFQQDWVEGIQANATALMEAMQNMQMESNQNATKMLEHIAAQEDLKKQAMDSALFGVVAGFGGLLIGGPVVGFTIGIPILLSAYSKLRQSDSRTQAQRKQELIKTVETWRDETITIMVIEIFIPKISKINKKVVDEASGNYAKKQLNWPLTGSELRDWHHKCEQERQRLLVWKQNRRLPDGTF